MCFCLPAILSIIYNAYMCCYVHINLLNIFQSKTQFESGG